MQLILRVVLLVFAAIPVFATAVLQLATDPVLEYVGKYKEIATSEMHRTGIPASIKLAQGILESNSGRSTLALKGNNHFGIKCGKYWEGESVMREDDDFKNGKLIPSCFRKYDDAFLSFIAHSDFLKNPGSQYRYGFLFELDPLDYYSWAKGLKKSGYATDPAYAEKLISIIEEYQLYTYDQGMSMRPPDEVLASQNNKERSTGTEPASVKKPSRRYLDIRNKEHRVNKGETMESIADKYNIDVDLFYMQNRIPKGRQPKVGEILKVEGYFHWGKRPKLEDKSKQDNSLIFEDGSMTISID